MALSLGLSQPPLVELLPERFFCFVANSGGSWQPGGYWVMEPPKHLSGDEFSSGFSHTLAESCQWTGQSRISARFSEPGTRQGDVTVLRTRGPYP